MTEGVITGLIFADLFFEVTFFLLVEKFVMSDLQFVIMMSYCFDNLAK